MMEAAQSEVIPDLSDSVSNVLDTANKINNEYRYYHCHLDWNGLKCNKVNGPEVLPIHKNTKLLFIKKYIPEVLDRQILKYKWLPSRVVIEK